MDFYTHKMLKVFGLKDPSVIARCLYIVCIGHCLDVGIFSKHWGAPHGSRDHDPMQISVDHVYLTGKVEPESWFDIII